MGEHSILAEGLRKTYVSPRGTVEAVRGIDLDVARGEFFGVLGPNGAGKTTTLGMLTTLIRPTAGRAEVAGCDVRRQAREVKRRIGVVSQGNTLDRKLTVAENLEFRARYFGVPPRESRRRAAELLELLELPGRRRALVYELSGGQARRLMVGRALVHRPDILFLDEPTAGVDPQARANMWELFRRLHDDDVTIVLTTHQLEEAERLCDRMAIVDHGRVLACGRMDDLIALAGTDTVVTATFDGPAPPTTGLDRWPGVHRVETDGSRVRVFTATADGVLSRLVRHGQEAGRLIRDATTTRPRLDDVFLTLTGREYRQ